MIERNIWIPVMISSVMLVFALNPDNPYGYYVLLRWVVCGTFAWLCYQAHSQRKQEWFIWMLGITAAVYNPLFAFHFGRFIWSFLNLIAIGIGVAALVRFKEKEIHPATENRPEEDHVPEDER